MFWNVCAKIIFNSYTFSSMLSSSFLLDARWFVFPVLVAKVSFHRVCTIFIDAVFSCSVLLSMKDATIKTLCLTLYSPISPAFIFDRPQDCVRLPGNPLSNHIVVRNRIQPQSTSAQMLRKPLFTLRVYSVLTLCIDRYGKVYSSKTSMFKDGDDASSQE